MGWRVLPDGRSGVVSLTGRSRGTWAGHGSPRAAEAHDARPVLQASPVPGRGHSLCGVALFPLHLELPRRRRTVGSAGDRGQLRNDPLLDDQVRPADRQEPEASTTGALAALASGRDGLFDRWAAHVPLAVR